jgi:hypothetical protein
VRLFRSGGILALTVIAALAQGTPARAQSNVSSADIQRLQDTVYNASRDIEQLRSRDAQLASQLQSELDDARDEVTYLRVKQRRNEPISGNEYSDLGDRIENIRSRARGDAGGGYSAPGGSGSTGDRRGSGTWSVDDRNPDRDRDTSRGPDTGRVQPSNPNEIPTGTEFDVRLERSLNSGTAQVEDRFEATTMVDLRNGDRVLVPAGSVMRGVVSSVTKATRTERKGALTVAFDRVTINGRAYPIRATVTQALESEGIKGEAGKIGAGAGIGAIIGGIIGGAKGALAGILIGGGGTIAATEGKDVDLPVGTVLRVRMDSPLTVR